VPTPWLTDAKGQGDPVIFDTDEQGRTVLAGEWEQETTFTPELLSCPSENIRVMDGRVVISVANGNARYVITGFQVTDLTGVLVKAKLERSELSYRVEPRQHQIIFTSL
jgi:hypothetical protein